MGLGEEYNATLVQDNRANHETIKINYGQEVELKGYLHDYQKNIKEASKKCLSSLFTPLSLHRFPNFVYEKI